MQAVSGAPTPQRIGEILLSRGVVSNDDLVRALELQKGSADAESNVLTPDMVYALRDAKGLDTASGTGSKKAGRLEG